MPVVQGLSVSALTQLLESLLDVNLCKLNMLSPDLLNSVSVLLREAALSNSVIAVKSDSATSVSKTAASEGFGPARKETSRQNSSYSLPTSLPSTQVVSGDIAVNGESLTESLRTNDDKSSFGSSTATYNNGDEASKKQANAQQQTTQAKQEKNPVKEITCEDELNTEMEACRMENKMLMMDFYSYSCKPCVKAMPRYVAFAKDHPEISWVKLNIDVIERKLRDKWDVKKIPRFISWKDGNVVEECGTGTPRFTSSLALPDFVDFVLKKNGAEDTTFAFDMDF